MLKKNRLRRLRRLIAFVLIAVAFLWASEATFAADEVVIFSGQSVVEYNGKGNALLDSHKTTPSGGKSVRVEFWRPKLSIILGPKPGEDVFSPSRIDWGAQDLAFEYQTDGVPKILSLSILVPVGEGYQEAVVLNAAPALMNLTVDGKWHTAVVHVPGWQKAFQAALDAKQIPEDALVSARIGIKVAHNGAIHIANLRAIPKQGVAQVSPTPAPSQTPEASPSPSPSSSPSPSPSPSSSSSSEATPTPTGTSASGVVVIFSGQSVVEHTGKGNA